MERLQPICAQTQATLCLRLAKGRAFLDYLDSPEASRWLTPALHIHLSNRSILTVELSASLSPNVHKEGVMLCGVSLCFYVKDHCTGWLSWAGDREGVAVAYCIRRAEMAFSSGAPHTETRSWQEVSGYDSLNSGTEEAHENINY
eukprot:3609048-Amphidinium_carterae.1